MLGDWRAYTGMAIQAFIVATCMTFGMNIDAKHQIVCGILFLIVAKMAHRTEVTATN